MKLRNLFFILFILVQTNSALYCQEIKGKPKRIKLNEETIIKDTSGNIIPYSIWKNAMDSGIGGIRVKSETEIIFKFYTEEEKKKHELALLKSAKPIESKFFRTGKKFPKLSTKDMFGNKINTKKLLGKILVINYWFINCGPCRAEMPALNKIVEKYKNDSSVVFISVALDDAIALEEFLKKFEFKYKIIDNGRFNTSANGINSFPTNVVVDKEGKVFFHSSGYTASTPICIDKSIDLLLKNKPDEN